MLIAVGLGNPGSEYTWTRHNTGFKAADDLAALAAGASVFRTEKNFKALVSEASIGAEKLLIVKPLTFMNLSGDAVQAVLSYFKVAPEDGLVVVCDDIHLETGRIRIRKKGSDGGHNGLKDIIRKVGTDAFTRVRVGVGGMPPGFPQIDWVLSRFDEADRPVMEEACRKAAEAVLMIASDGVDRAMNVFNEKPKFPEEPDT